MSRSTGPILAIGGITLVNQSIVHAQPIDWKVPIATGMAAGAFALMERAMPDVATGIAWLALVTLLFTRLNPGIPSPAESFTRWWKTP